MGRGGTIRRLARVAIPLCGIHASMALGVCVGRTRSAALGNTFPPWRQKQRRREGGAPAFERRNGSVPSAAPRVLYLLPLRRAVVRRQLLLDSRHDDALRRHAAACAGIADALDSAWYWGSTSASSGWGLCWFGGRRVPRGWLWCLRPFLWTGLDLAAARITSVPWDQLGYSQIDNALINQLAPFIGVYGITFILVAVNALFAVCIAP